MASPQDYFTPGEMPAAQPDQNIMPSIASFMNNPQALNALLAFGTQAMIPQWGGAGVQFAKGVGAAGEAASANEASKQKQQEIDSKAELRASQAGAAEAKANTAATRSSLTGMIEEGKRQRANDLGRIRLTNMYNNYARTIDAKNKAIDASNSNPLRPVGSPPTPIERTMPMEEWIKSNPMLQNMGLLPPPGTSPTAGEEGDVNIPSTATSTQATAAPQNPVVGQVYPSARGPMKYLGNDKWGPA